MKKIFLVLFALFFMIIVPFFCYSTYSEGSSIGDNLKNTLNGLPLVGTNGGDAKVSGGFSNTVMGWTRNISVILAVFAVLGIVYGSFKLVVSQGESEKATKAKNVIQWSIFGFLGVITASFIINLIIRIMYSI